MATHLDLTESGFIQQFTQLSRDRRGLVLRDQPGGACIFLDGNNCQVQPAKPQQCRDFPNLWNFPGFQEHCQAIPRRVSAAEYRRLVAQATGRHENTLVIPEETVL